MSVGLMFFSFFMLFGGFVCGFMLSWAVGEDWTDELLRKLHMLDYS